MNKRKVILGCIAAVFLFLLGGSVFLLKQKHDFKQSIADIPEFCLQQVVDSLLFCNTQLVKDNPVILMYFHPECDFCQTEAIQIQQNAGNTGDIQWVLVSYAEKDSLQKFMEVHQLVDVPNLVMLMDSQFILYNHLWVKSIPTSYVYDRQHRLVKIIHGIERFENLLWLANYNL